MTDDSRTILEKAVDMLAAYRRLPPDDPFIQEVRAELTRLQKLEADHDGQSRD